MINWSELILIENSIRIKTFFLPKNDWREEIASSICELYYIQCVLKRNEKKNEVILINNVKFNRFLKIYMKPLKKYFLWEALFPTFASTNSANAIDEALILLVESKLIDCVYSGDEIAINKIIFEIKKKRAKYNRTI